MAESDRIDNTMLNAKRIEHVLWPPRCRKLAIYTRRILDQHFDEL